MWSRLTTESQGQRDQTDHLRGYVVALKADQALIESIIRKRMERAASDMDRKGVDPYTIFFMALPLTVLYFLAIGLCKYFPRNKSPFEAAPA